MAPGFVEIAPRLVYENPGRTSREIAELAMSKGVAAPNIRSLSTTLDQYVRRGRFPEITREPGPDGILRYYPRSTFSRIRLELTLICSYRETGEITQQVLKTAEGESISEVILNLSEAIMQSHSGSRPEAWQLRQDLAELTNVLRATLERRSLM